MTNDAAAIPGALTGSTGTMRTLMPIKPHEVRRQHDALRHLFNQLERS